MSSSAVVLDRACHWLRAVQHADGSWRDFWTPSGVSDQWVTAYVGAALALAGEERSSPRAAWGYLQPKQHPDGGWGYSAEVPSDADSTAWALALAGRVGEAETEGARRAAEFIRGARVRGGIATYPQAEEIRAYVQGGPSPDFSGWTQAHACVTAAAAQCACLRQEFLDDLLASQRPDGSWRSYWWFDDAYATALASAVLAGVDGSASGEALERAVSWAVTGITDVAEATPFALSLLLCILRHGEDAERHCRSVASTLESLQSSDGSWRGTAKLRIPRPDVRDPVTVARWERWWGSGEPFDIYSLDQSSVFTTATAFAALQMLALNPKGNAALG